VLHAGDAVATMLVHMAAGHEAKLRAPQGLGEPAANRGDDVALVDGGSPGS
jgi:hypothetical protein